MFEHGIIKQKVSAECIEQVKHANHSKGSNMLNETKSGEW